MRNIYLIVLIAVAAVFVAPSVMAAASTTTFSAEIASVLTCTATPDALNFGTVTPSDTVQDSETNVVKVICNDHDGYSLVVNSNDADGKMFNAANKLEDPLDVTIGSLNDAHVLLATQTVVAVGARNNPLGTTYTGTYEQLFKTTDPAGTFGLVLTYTASAL